jgi:hypothetical protein
VQPPESQCRLPQELEKGGGEEPLFGEEKELELEEKGQQNLDAAAADEPPEAAARLELSRGEFL